MEKIGMLKNEKMGNYELENGYASYKTIVDYFIGDIVLCNNIIKIDKSVFDNLEIEPKYYNGNDEEITEEEYFNDSNAYCDNSTPEIFQYYLCNVWQWDAKQAKKAGLILSYSDLLDCDVLCVDHLGTNWSDVLTVVKLFDNYEDLKKYEEESKTNENE